MPGLSFFAEVERGIDPLLDRAHGALRAVCHDHTYRSAEITRDRSHLLAVSAYPEYPLSSHQFGDATIHLEGRIYGPGIEATLRQLAALVFRPDAPERTRQWLRGIDGEFVAVVSDRPSGRFAILNDLLGRLPLYCHRGAGSLVVSREPRVAAALSGSARFDPMGMAQFLLFGFPLGRRTLLADVEQIAPATLVRIDARARTIDVTSAPPLDLGPAPGPPADARELAMLFSAACRARAAAGDAVVSLSGGADSRSVAAGLHRLGIPFGCATFIDAAGTAAADAAIAERLAGVFGAPWHPLRLAPASAEERRRLIRHKGGLNPLSMAYLMPYLEQVRARFGAGITFFTGDGGDKLLPDLRSGAPIGDADAAADAALRARQIMSIDLACGLTGVRRDDLYGEVRDRISTYPEADWSDRHVHFEILERGRRWLFEGEDRNRGYVWSTTPFYATPFFLAAMRLDSAEKAHRRLARDFLVALSPSAAAVEYAGVGASIDSDAFRVATKAASLLAARGARLPGALASTSRDAAAVDSIAAIRARLAGGGAIGAHLRADALTAFLDGPVIGLPAALDALDTLTAAIEDFATESRGATPDLADDEAIAAMSRMQASIRPPGANPP